MENEAENRNDEQQNEKDKTPEWNTLHIILVLLSLLPILVWPYVHAASFWILIRDDRPPTPVEEFIQWSVYFAVNAYPLFLIANVIVSRLLFKANRPGSSILVLLWPLILIFMLWAIFGSA